MEAPLVATTELRKLEPMMKADSIVRARIPAAVKQRATDALARMGLSVSDAIRILMTRVAEEERLPFDVKVPNPTTLKAMAELEGGKGKKSKDRDALFRDLEL